MKTELFASSLINYDGGAVISIENVGVAQADPARQLVMEAFKQEGADMVQFYPQILEFSYATQIFSITPKEGQLVSGDVVQLKISSLDN